MKTEHRYVVTYKKKDDFDVSFDLFIEPGGNVFDSLAKKYNEMPSGTLSGYQLDSIILTNIIHSVDRDPEPEQPTPAAEVIIELSKRVSALERWKEGMLAPVAKMREAIMENATSTYDAGL